MANNDDCIRMVPNRPTITPGTWSAATWTDVDVSAYDPNGHAVHAIIEVGINVANTEDLIYARKNGSSTGIGGLLRIRGTAIDATLTTAWVTAIVSLDSSRIFEVYKTNSGDTVTIRIAGFMYGTSYVKQIEPPVDKTPTSTLVFETVDITSQLASGDSGSVLAAIVHFAVEDNKGGHYLNGLRHPSSTDTNRVDVGQYSDFYGLVKCNSSNQFQARVINDRTKDKLYVLGYIKTGGKLVMHTDPQSHQVTVTCGSVQTVDLTSHTSASARCVTLRDADIGVGGAWGSDRWFGHPDETHHTGEDIGSTVMSYFAGLNSTQDVEAYLVNGLDASHVIDVIGYVETESQSQTAGKVTALQAPKTPTQRHTQNPGKVTALSAPKVPTQSRVQYADKALAASSAKAVVLLHAILAGKASGAFAALTGQTNMVAFPGVSALSVSALTGAALPGAYTVEAGLAAAVTAGISPTVVQAILAEIVGSSGAALSPSVLQAVTAGIASGASSALAAGVSLAELALTPGVAAVAVAALDAGLQAGAFTVVVDVIPGADSRALSVLILPGGLSVGAPLATATISVLDGSILTLIRVAAAVSAISGPLSAALSAGPVTLSGGIVQSGTSALPAGLRSVFTFTPAAVEALSSALSSTLVIAPITLLAVKVAAAVALLEAICYRVFGQVAADLEALSGPSAHGAAIEAAGASDGALVHSGPDGEGISSAILDDPAMTSSSADDEEAL